jgi:hypothetical protein
VGVSDTRLSKNGGVQFFRSLSSFWGPFGLQTPPKTDPLPIFGNNDGIFMILRSFWGFLIPGYPKMAGCKFSHPSTPFGGHFGLQTPPKTDPLPIFGNNDGIFMILRSFWGFLLILISFMTL